ncbi:NepR family anti-sigma factor [Rubellimicrobium thermophilum]
MSRSAEPNAAVARSVPKGNTWGTGLGMYMDMSDAKGKSRLHQQIDENLRRVYEDLLNEEVPDRFRDLIAQLKARETEREKRS